MFSKGYSIVAGDPNPPTPRSALDVPLQSLELLFTMSNFSMNRLLKRMRVNRETGEEMSKCFATLILTPQMLRNIQLNVTFLLILF